MAKTLNRREFLTTCRQAAVVGVGCTFLPIDASSAADAEILPQKGFILPRLSPYFTPLENQVIRCELCPHHCEVGPDERGECRVRKNIDGKYYTLVYGNPCAIHVDPVEKKPFFHVLPGTRSFSLATAGCNFECKFCQNWNISQAKPDDTSNYRLLPADILSLAANNGCASIASTYVEPTIFMEYMLDIGKMTKGKSLLNVMHSNGFVAERPLRDLCRVLNAACIDLKGFNEEYYRSMTGGRLAPVLNSLRILCEQNVHTELVNLVIPGRNDDPAQIRAMCRWISQELGAAVPLHFSRFYPRYKLKGIAPTPVTLLEKARDIALEEGLEYVYIGNVFRHFGEHTYCPVCKKMLIERSGYTVNVTGLVQGRCKYCQKEIPGIWRMPSKVAGPESVDRHPL